MRYFRNPKIFTGEGEEGFVTAFAERDGVITWTGDAADIPNGAEVHDIDAQVVLPGLIDAHTHPTYIAMTIDAVACTPPEVNSIPEMVEALRRRSGSTQGWIRGWGYDEAALAEGRTPTRHDLDLVSRDRPVHVLRSDCHSGICNSRALEIAGITESTPDPQGAWFGREEDGAPNGVLGEFAANCAVTRFFDPSSFEDEVVRLVRTSERLAAHGIVACTDMLCVPGEYTQLDLYRAAASQGFRQQARVFYDFAALADHPIPPIGPDDVSGRIALGGVKVFLDGSISNCTAWMHHPYCGRGDNTGLRTASHELLTEALDFARRNGIQLAVHAMGDRAIAEVVATFAAEEPWLKEVPSVRIEHGTVMTTDVLEQMRKARMNFGVATNIDFFFAEYASYSKNLGAEQFARSYPVRDLYEALDAVALTSDCPATTWAEPDNPFVSIHAAVNRRAHNGESIVAAQAITVAQALLMYTGRARKLTVMPGVGVIAPGYEASFVAVADDPFTVDPIALIDVSVAETWIAGECVYAASS